MRLLNTATLELQEFNSETRIDYAIISHRWGPDEVSFRDIQDLAKACQKRGFDKVRSFCAVAASDGFECCWIDTCCINKESSSELSEAINSMYRWYQSSVVCYVYLDDVRRDNFDEDFAQSQWFKRGWTLQELLAPRRLIFYDSGWNKLGYRDDLLNQIEGVTGIHRNAMKEHRVHDFSIAERMKWASKRSTTRPEDAAYSLLGIFDVNMPLLYGEGAQKAFFRLQEQIIKDSDDRSIFTWTGARQQATGMLAQSPKFFSRLTHKPKQMSLEILTSPFAITNRGLSIDLYLSPIAFQTYITPIHSPDGSTLCYIFLRSIDGTGQYVRVDYRGSETSQTGASGGIPEFIMLASRRVLSPRPYFRKSVHVQQHLNYRALYNRTKNGPRVCPRFRFGQLVCDDDSKLTLDSVDTRGKWDHARLRLDLENTHIGTAGIFSFSFKGKRKYKEFAPQKVLIGLDFDFRPVCIVGTESAYFTAPQYGQKDEILCRDYGTGEIPEDVSVTKLTDITCFESRGWSTLEKNSVGVVNGHRGLWAIKMGAKQQLFAWLEPYWFIDIHLGWNDGRWEWCITFCFLPDHRNPEKRMKDVREQEAKGQGRPPVPRSQSVDSPDEINLFEP